MWTYNSYDELYHHGIRGMKWGIRRFQNHDGSLTSAGKKRRSSEEASKSDKGRKKTDLKKKVKPRETKEAPQTKKKISEMSDDELKTMISRMQMEKQVYELNKQIAVLNPQQVSAGKKFVDTMVKEVAGPALKDAGKTLLTDYLKKKGAEALGLKKEDADVAFKSLQKEVQVLALSKQKNELSNYFNDLKNNRTNSSNKNSSVDKEEAARKARLRKEEEARKERLRKEEEARKERLRKVEEESAATMAYIEQEMAKARKSWESPIAAWDLVEHTPAYTNRSTWDKESSASKAELHNKQLDANEKEVLDWFKRESDYRKNLEKFK